MARVKTLRLAADREADRILDKLPRTRGTSFGALVWVDAAGRLMISLAEGVLYVNERDLNKVRGDELA